MHVHPTATAVLLVAAVAVPDGGLVRAAEGDVVELAPFTVDGIHDTRDPERALHVVSPGTRPGGAGGLPTLASHLAGLPEVITQESFGGFDPPRLTLRGSGLQSAPVSRGVWWTLDGLPINAVDGSFNSALVEPALVGQVGVAVGAADPAAAATSLGGALHLSSPSPASAQAWLSAGDDGFLRAGLADGTTFREAEAWGGVSYAHWQGWRPQSAQERLAFAGALGGRIGEDGPGLRVAWFAADASFDVPGALTLDAAQQAPRSISSLVAADQPRRETRFARLALELAWPQSAQDFTRLAFAAQHTDDWFRQLRANGVSDTAGADLSILLDMRRSLGTHALHAGLLTRFGSRDQTRWLNTGGATGARFAELDLEAGHAVAWLDDEWALAPDIMVEAGLSLVDATREAAGAPTGACGRFDDRAAAPRLGLAWQAHSSLRLTARATRGIESPTFDDALVTRGAPGALTLAWSPLRAQRADTLELGASGELGPLTYTCVAYRSRWEDELLRLADGAGAPLGTVNAGRTRHAGLEAALRWRILGGGARALDLTVSHAWSRATFEEDPAYRGRELAGLPPHAGSARLTWAGDHGLFTVVGATWVAGTTWADHANRLGYSGRTRANLRLGWADRRGWSVFVDVDNLFDRAGIASTSGVIDIARNPATTAVFLPGLPRQTRLGFSWSH